MPNKKNTIALFFSIYHKYPPAKSTICAPLILMEEICSKINKKKFKSILIAPQGSKLDGVEIYSNKIKPLFGTKPPRGQNLKLSQKILKSFLQEKKVNLLNCHHPLFALPILKNINIPILHTFHDPINKKIAGSIKKNDSPNYYYNFLSKNHAKNFSIKNRCFIINNGLKLKNYKFNSIPKKDLLFSGRLIEKKGVYTAIKIAQETNLLLNIAGSHQGSQYWNKKIKPNLNKNIKYVGMVPFKKMPSLYRQAKILLFPIKWQEPFGLVMIEAMACGTPVVAFNRGAVSEVVKDGVTGYIVKNEKEMIRAVKIIYTMPKNKYIKMRHACRRHVEKNFTIEKMVDNYEKVYYKIVEDFKKK